VEGEMKVALLDLKQQNSALAPQLQQAFQRVLESGQFILGREVEELERSVAAVVEAKFALGVSSGTDAILLALMALGIGHGDEVICPSFTFFATAGCIARTGAKAVFADSCPVCFNLDVEDAARRITPRTKAIMPVHLFGQAAEMDDVMALASKHGLRVVEDAAQALGAGYRGRKLGSIGDFGTFSFFPSKNLGGFGDSGLLVTNDESLAGLARIMRTHGSKPKYFHKVIGGNFRIDPLLAALLAVKLPHLPEYTQRRQENAAYYTAGLSQIPGVKTTPLPGANGNCSCGVACRQTDGGHILLPVALPHADHIWNQYTLRIQAAAPWKNSGNPRDALQKYLASQEVGSEIYYPRPMHQQECFAPGSGQLPAPLPVAEQLAGECLSIPIYPELRREQVDTVIDAIRAFLKENAAA
jgi:dTDP-4-amino-4,6-dideoxygalactose transaminase